MNDFAKVLRTHVRKLNIKIQSLSMASGVDRTLIQKMMKGERVPADPGIVDKLISVMMLTPNQAEELRSLYHIARIGKDIYSRHLLVKKLFESFGNYNKATTPLVKTEFQHKFLESSGDIVLNDIHEVNHIVKTVLEAESMNPKGKIKLIIQPEYTFLIELLSILGDNNPSLHIEHIFCLQKSVLEDDENRYNLDSIKNIVPLLISSCEYSPCIYYEDISAHVTNTSILPFMILTEDKAISLSHDYTSGILFQDPSVYRMLSRIFDSISLNTAPLLQKFTDPMEYYSYYSNLEVGYETLENNLGFKYSLFSQPCLMFFLTESLANKYVIDFPMKKELVELVTYRADAYLTMLKQGHEFTSFFSLAGLDNFWQTGRILEIPDSFYSPVEQEDCLALLKQLYDSSLHGSYSIQLINSNKFKLSPNLIISAISESSISFMCIHPKRGAIHFTLNEKSIAHSIFCFLEYLSGSEMLYSKSKSLSILKNKIDEYASALNRKAE